AAACSWRLRVWSTYHRPRAAGSPATSAAASATPAHFGLLHRTELIPLTSPNVPEPGRRPPGSTTYGPRTPPARTENPLSYILGYFLALGFALAPLRRGVCSDNRAVRRRVAVRTQRH